MKKENGQSGTGNAAGNENIAVRFDGVTIGYTAKTAAVENVSFDVERGDFLLIVGENGSGKSTLVKGMLGLVPLSAGKIEFPVKDMEKKIGYLPQSADVNRDFPATVREVVLSGFAGKHGLFSFYSHQDRKKAGEILRYLDIEKLESKSFRALSGGERQKVLLARALCSATRCDVCRKHGCHCHDETFCHTDGLIVLDEPSNGLDPVANRYLYDVLTKLNREKGMTVIMVSHLVGSAQNYANKILHMGTTLKFYGTKADYLATPLGHDFFSGAHPDEVPD